MECLQSSRYHMNHYLYYIEYLRFMTRKYRAGTESLEFIVLSQQNFQDLHFADLFTNELSAEIQDSSLKWGVCVCLN